MSGLPPAHPSGGAAVSGAGARLRRRIEAVAASVFAGWGYEEVLAPLFDYSEVFARSGRWSERAAYRFTEAGDLLALRADFTALVARIAATQLPREVTRLFYRGETVRRQERRLGPETGSETGIEHFGGGPEADLETLLVALEVLDRLEVPGCFVTLGHAGFPLGLLDAALESVPAPDALPDARPDARSAARREALAGLYRRDRARIREALGPAAGPLTAALDRAGGPEVLAASAAGEDSLPQRARHALARLRTISETLAALGLADRFGFDLAEMRGFDYYTGLVFEIHAPGAGVEIGGGGRYDDLFGNYGEPRPAVGFAIQVDRVAALLEAGAPAEPPPAPLPVAGRAPEDLAAVFGEALKARRSRRPVRISPEPPAP